MSFSRSPISLRFAVLFSVNVLLAITLAVSVPLMRKHWTDYLGEEGMPSFTVSMFQATQFWSAVFVLLSSLGLAMSLRRSISDARLNLAFKAIGWANLVFVGAFLVAAFMPNIVLTHRIGP